MIVNSSIGSPISECDIHSMEEQKEILQDKDSELKSSKPKLSKKTVYLSRLKRRILKHVWIVRGLLLIGLILGIFSVIFLAGTFIKNTSLGFYMGLAGDFLFTPVEKIKSFENRTNIIILGKGGEGHEAPDLTDTMMFVSVKHESPSVSLVSLPRDIWITDLRTKLNSVYYWGNKKEEGGGLVLAKSTIEEIVGQPVHYALVVDFSGFKKVINVLGGVDVNVQNSFSDEKYPIAGRENDLCEGDPEYKCRYETIRFEKGVQNMDGETALKFVRSRYAEGDEGTDLARAARQDRVVEAIKNKILSREILTSPKKLIELKSVMNESIETDMPTSAEAILVRRVFNARKTLTSKVLPEDLLENPPKSVRYDNLYVFIPREVDSSDSTRRSWSKVQEWVKCTLEGRQCS